MSLLQVRHPRSPWLCSTHGFQQSSRSQHAREIRPKKMPQPTDCHFACHLPAGAGPLSLPSCSATSAGPKRGEFVSAVRKVIVGGSDASKPRFPLPRGAREAGRVH